MIEGFLRIKIEPRRFQPLGSYFKQSVEVMQVYRIFENQKKSMQIHFILSEEVISPVFNAVTWPRTGELRWRVRLPSAGCSETIADPCSGCSFFTRINKVASNADFDEICLLYTKLRYYLVKIVKENLYYKLIKLTSFTIQFSTQSRFKSYFFRYKAFLLR